MQAELRVYKGDRAQGIASDNQGSVLEELVVADAVALIKQVQARDIDYSSVFNVTSHLIKGDLSADVMWLEANGWVVIYYNSAGLPFATVVAPR